MKFLAVGGAGYIGSHFYRHATRQGHEVAVLDNYSTGFRQSLPTDAKVFEADIRDTDKVAKAIEEFRPDVVLHYAAFSFVGESVQFPEKYMDNNVGGMKSLLAALKSAGPVPIVFSSTCAVYGNPEVIPVDETAPIAPMSPYGESKVLCETELREYCASTGKPAFALRYFNACGADSEGGIGESHFPTQRLISSIFHAINEKKVFTLHGEDFDTPDGTCVRDYIHVTDLAEAHILAAKQLEGRDCFDVVNLGTGAGTSNKEILDAVEKTQGNPVDHKFGPRREGDPARLFADCTKANSVLNFSATYSSIDNVIKTASDWHLENPKGYQ